MTNNETILDLIMRDIVCADTLEHLEAQMKALDDRRLATVKERNAIAEKIVPMIWPNGPTEHINKLINVKSA